jgi:glycosyltransferase involved in cell wall biosynthesis
MLNVMEPLDVGLLLVDASGDQNLRTLAGASNKPFEYLAKGLPILIGNQAALSDLFVTTGYARECDPTDPLSIAEAIQWFRDNPDLRREMGESGRRRILEEWNYEQQFAPVLERLEAG